MIIKQYNPVALLASDECVSWNRFMSDLEAMCSCVDKNAGRIAVYSLDTYAFVVAAIAVLRSGKQLVVLQNNLPTTLEKYCSSYDQYLEIDDSKISALPEADLPDIELIELDSRSRVTFYTSGSTGNPAEIQKTLGQLTSEVSDTSSQLRIRGAKAILSTVSHQHMYGFLFKFITPVVNGITVVSPIVRYPSQMTGVDDYILISSPAFLVRLESSERIEGARLVLSSGGPLPYETGLKSKEVFDCGGFEIYGSTETGGVAFRSFDVERYFTPFSGVSIRSTRDGVLEIQSRYIDERVWVTTSDQIEHHANGTFSLIGRVDDIVKIEEKRISLTEIANLINSHYAWIDRSYVVTYEFGRRIKLAALIVANVKLTEYDSARLVENITRELRNYIDPVFVPRTWKVVNQLEENEVGKVTKATIMSKIFLDHIEKEDNVSVTI